MEAGQGRKPNKRRGRNNGGNAYCLPLGSLLHEPDTSPRPHNMTVPGKTCTSIYSPQTENQWRSKVRRLPDSNWWTSELYWGYVQGCGWEVTYRSRNESRQLHHQSQHQYWWQLTKAGNPEHTVQPAGNSSSWRASFPGGSIGLNLLQRAWPFLKSLLGSLLCLKSLVSVILSICIRLGMEGPTESAQFQVLSEVCWVV